MTLSNAFSGKGASYPSRSWNLGQPEPLYSQSPSWGPAQNCIRATSPGILGVAALAQCDHNAIPTHVYLGPFTAIVALLGPPMACCHTMDDPLAGSFAEPNGLYVPGRGNPLNWLFPFSQRRKTPSSKQGISTMCMLAGRFGRGDIVLVAVAGALYIYVYICSSVTRFQGLR